MINLTVAPVEPRWRRWLGLTPRQAIVMHTPDGLEVIARFKGDGHTVFFQWMDEQATELTKMIQTLNSSGHGVEIMSHHQRNNNG